MTYSSYNAAAKDSEPESTLILHRESLAQLLLCHPCPHGSSCCRRGVSVTEHEAAAIMAGFGSDAVVWNSEEEGYRTRVVGQRCLFFNGEGCDLHDSGTYPQLCLYYPWFGLDGLVYKFEIDLCPEILNRRDLSVLLDDNRQLLPSAIRLALQRMAHHEAGSANAVRPVLIP